MRSVTIAFSAVSPSDVRDSMSRRSQTGVRWLVVIGAMMLMVQTVYGWGCVCNPRECEVLEPSGCPGMGIVVWDPCRCCKVCARTVGEECGGFRGTCEPGLKCHDETCIPTT